METRIYCALNHKKYACLLLTKNHLPYTVEDVLEREKATVISLKDNIVFAKNLHFHNCDCYCYSGNDDISSKKHLLWETCHKGCFLYLFLKCIEPYCRKWYSGRKKILSFFNSKRSISHNATRYH